MPRSLQRGGTLAPTHPQTLVRSIPSFCIALAILALVGAEALAHGGSYRGPGGGIGTGRGGGSTGGRSQGGVTGVSLEAWELWWAFNREEFLWSSGLRRAGERPEPEGQEKSLEQRVREDLMPILEAALKDRDVDMRDTAAFVLGKTGLQEAIPLLEGAAGDKVQSVVEAVALGLGSLGHEDAIPVLVKILKSSRTKGRTRAYAGLALGFIGGDRAYDTLLAGVGFAKKRSEPLEVRNLDVDSARILGMGLTSTAEARRHLIHLSATASDRKERLKSLLPLALARAGDRDSTPAVLELLKDRNVQVRRSAAIALGRLATPDHAEAVKRLQYTMLTDADNSVKNFCAISLGRIGSEECVAFLKKHFAKTPYITRAFVALALGISADPSAASLLENEFHRCKEQSMRGACAIALGILGHATAGDAILAVLEKEKNDSFRSDLATALGLMAFERAVPTLKTIVARERDPRLRGEAGEALALIGDDQAIDVLVGLLEKDEGIFLTSSVAVALGRLRTPESFDALLEIAKSPRRNTLVRSFALAAIGRIIDPNVPPVLSRMVIDHNYRIEMGYVYDLLSLL